MDICGTHTHKTIGKTKQNYPAQSFKNPTNLIVVNNPIYQKHKQKRNIIS